MYTVEQLLKELRDERASYSRMMERYVEDYSRDTAKISALEDKIVELKQENIILMETLAEERKRNGN